MYSAGVDIVLMEPGAYREVFGHILNPHLGTGNVLLCIGGRGRGGGRGGRGRREGGRGGEGREDKRERGREGREGENDYNELTGGLVNFTTAFHT